jgi:hypothetical protein
VSSETYVGNLLERARAQADLKAFITIDEASVLQAARQADRSLLAGRLPLMLDLGRSTELVGKISAFTDGGEDGIRIYSRSARGAKASP